MSPKDLRDLFTLAAIWSSSFIFMLLAIEEFGTFALMWVRVGASSLFLFGLAMMLGKLPLIIAHWRPIALTGLFSAALPFSLLGYAAHSMTAGTLSVTNAMTPLFGALVARVWLNESLSKTRVLGLAIGFAGIVVLVSDNLSVGGDSIWAILAAIAAPLCYGISACIMTRYLQGVDPIASATGSMIATAVLLLPFAYATWPPQPISSTAWLSALALGIICTGIAYVMFFRLISRIGSTRAITVTFLTPPLGIIWGIIFLGETLTLSVVLGAGIVLAGTFLALGIWPRHRPQPGQ